MKKLIFFVGITLCVLSPFFVEAQLLDPVSYTFEEVPDTVNVGEVFDVTVIASIDENWHLYSVLNNPELGPYPTQFSAPSSEMVISGEPEESEAEIEYDPNFEAELGWHSNSANFKVPLSFQSGVQGEQIITLEVFYQVCDDRSCLPPKTKEISADVYVAGISDSSIPKNNQSNQYSVLWITGILSSITIFILLAFYFYRLFRK